MAEHPQSFEEEFEAFLADQSGQSNAIWIVALIVGAVVIFGWVFFSATPARDTDPAALPPEEPASAPAAVEPAAPETGVIVPEPTAPAQVN